MPNESDKNEDSAPPSSKGSKKDEKPVDGSFTAGAQRHWSAQCDGCHKLANQALNKGLCATCWAAKK